MMFSRVLLPLSTSLLDRGLIGIVGESRIPSAHFQAPDGMLVNAPPLSLTNVSGAPHPF